MPQSIRQLTPNLWVAQSELYLTNSGIFLSGEQACLIDPAVFPHEIEAIARFVAKQKAVPQTIVLTHSHWDHILAPKHLPGIKTIAHTNYLAETSGENGLRIRRQVEQWAAHSGVECKEPFVIPNPDEIFADTLEVTVGNQTLNLIHAPGHAADQLVVYHQCQGVLWAGDMLSDLEIPYCHHLALYEQTLKRLASLDVRVLIPGHGHATTDAEEIRFRFAHDRAYLAGLREGVEKAVDEGKTIAETVEMCSKMSYRHPETNREAHEKNVESAYVEMGGTVDGSKLGWDRLGDEAT
jgi:hydroxyacylglutathione hydrolase